MSIFSENIIEDPWVGMAYKFWNCTNPKYQTDIWNHAFELNFSKTKIKSTLKSLLLRSDGTMKMSEYEFDEMNRVLDEHSIYELNKIYSSIILICLLIPSLSEDNLSNILTLCLKSTKLRTGSDVSVKIRFPENEHTFIVIQVNTFTPQRIEITLKRK